MSPSASGLYHRRGWTVEIGDDAEADEVLVASIHEAMHDRLQMTTMHGCLVDLLQGQAGSTQNDRAGAVQREATNVHEQFATWMSTVPTGWTSDRLRQAFPLYLRHLNRAGRRVASLRGRYVAMHATQAVARSCMQSADLADLLRTTDLHRLEPSVLDRRMRPDFRLARLDKALATSGWGPLSDWPGDIDSLELERFADENDPEWLSLNTLAYDYCRELLDQAGLPTLPYDGHVPTVRFLAGESGPSGAREDGASPSSAQVALMSVESESMVLSPPIQATVLSPTTPLHQMLCGDQKRRHLFLAIRPKSQVATQYNLSSSALPNAEHVALLRCQAPDGGVELLDVTDLGPAALTEIGRVVTSVAMSSLATPDILRQWAPLLGRHQATVLCDLRPSANLPGWLADPRLQLRYALFGVEGRSGWVRFLAFRIEDGTTSSRIYLTPVSRLYSSGLQLWLAETPAFRNRAVLDQDLADEPLVRFSVAHILLEERVFNFTIGDPHG